MPALVNNQYRLADEACPRKIVKVEDRLTAHGANGDLASSIGSDALLVQGAVLAPARSQAMRYLGRHDK